MIWIAIFTAGIIFALIAIAHYSKTLNDIREKEMFWPDTSLGPYVIRETHNIVPVNKTILYSSDLERFYVNFNNDIKYIPNENLKEHLIHDALRGIGNYLKDKKLLKIWESDHFPEYHPHTKRINIELKVLDPENVEHTEIRSY